MIEWTFRSIDNFTAGEAPSDCKLICLSSNIDRLSYKQKLGYWDMLSTHKIDYCHQQYHSLTVEKIIEFIIRTRAYHNNAY